MPIEIMKKIIAKKDKVVAEKNAEGSSPTAAKLSIKSTAAILDGLGSTSWREYMLEFDPTPEELARLMGRDDAFLRDYMPNALAYIVANGTCGTDTTTQLNKNVDPNIDLP